MSVNNKEFTDALNKAIVDTQPTLLEQLNESQRMEYLQQIQQNNQPQIQQNQQIQQNNQPQIQQNQPQIQQEIDFNIDTLVGFCKEKGFIFPSSDIYGGIKGFFDYGHYGVQLKRNIIDAYFSFFVTKRENIISQDGSIISNPNVWRASGHVDKFNDPILITQNNLKYRADHFIEENLNVSTEGMSNEKIFELIQSNNLKYNNEDIVRVDHMNLMFVSQVGTPSGSINNNNNHHQNNDNTVYLRPETCQNIFCNAKYLANVNRMSLPFGITQIGKVFRNEIAPKNFIFRCREFEQMEIEYFFNPSTVCSEVSDRHKTFDINCKFADGVTQLIQLNTLLDLKLLNTHHLYWLAEMLIWLTEHIGLRREELRIREHAKDELSHYSSATFDIEFRYPFGSQTSDDTNRNVFEYKELCGVADRGNYDLSQHAQFSKQNLLFFDSNTKEKLIPHVIEPSIGLERLFLAVLCSAYEFDKERDYVVLHLNSKLCPVECAVLPLVNKFVPKAREVFENLVDKNWRVSYDKGGSIGRRYARQDELGTKWCITIDGETDVDNTVTVRDRDTKEQKRVKIEHLSKCSCIEELSTCMSF